MKTDLRPEDYWPEAEKLLDNHYKSKRNRKIILWFAAVLTIVGVSVYFTIDRKSNSNTVSDTEIQNNIQSNNYSPANVNRTDAKKEITSSVTVNNNSHTSEVVSESKNEIKPQNNLPAKTDQNLSQKNIDLPNRKQNNKSKEVSSKSASIQTSIAISSTSQTSHNSQPFTQNSDIKTTALSSEQNVTKNAFPEIQGSELLVMNSPKSEILKTNSSDIQLPVSRNSDVTTPKIQRSVEFRLNVLAGANLMTKKFDGYENSATETKRNDGEKEVITPQLSIEVSRVTDKYSLSLGLNYIQYGEKVDYDPTSKSKVTIDNSYWNTYTTTVIDTDTNYVYGFVYFSQQATQRQDSSYISQTDTVEQTVINDNILKSTGTNVISYIEVPLSMSYYLGKNKFRYGISAGVSAGFLIYSNGYYLNQSGTDVINIKEEKVFKSVIFNGQVGLDFRYCLSPNLHLLFRPQYRVNLDSIIKEGKGFEQKYSSYGLSAGISWLIR